MKKQFFCLRIAFIFLFFPATTIVQAQEPATYGKNAFSFNLTRLAVNEVNLSFEHFLSSRRSIEFNGGLVYVNNYLEDQAKEWSNAVFFSEHGYAGRFHYKIFKRPEDNSKWHNYIAFGVVYKHLYYDDLFIKDNVVKYDSSLIKTNPVLYKDSGAFQYSEEFLRDESRNKIGVEFLWGKVYESSKTIAFEFYYGAGITASQTTHTDHSRNPVYLNTHHQWISKPIPDFTYKTFYMRPAILLGLKLRLRM